MVQALFSTNAEQQGCSSVGYPYLGKNIGQNIVWCSLMWLMPLRSLSNCDYKLNSLPRLILGPIHPSVPITEPGIPGRIPSIRPIHINRTTKNATAAHTCAPSPKQSTRDWFWIPGEIGWDWPVRHPARLATSTAHRC